jgi:hypothetical protein
MFLAINDSWVSAIKQQIFFVFVQKAFIFAPLFLIKNLIQKYPKEFTDKDCMQGQSERVSVTFEVSPDQRDYLLKMVMDD